jgi:omega-hydroxy-beta-dihydromenaquinone-9 sulfotransferase
MSSVMSDTCAIASVSAMSVVCVFSLYRFSPFMLWRSFFVVVRCVVTSKDISSTQRASMAWHLVKDFLIVPLYTLAWMLDRVLYPAVGRVEVRRPIFIMGQPRSGTTFLHRTLSLDRELFFSLKHLEWRYPFLAFWQLIDFFKLRSWIESFDYWPNSKVGRLAAKLHDHRLGSAEEHGIFFEERMYHHYFTFRRFPFPEVLQRVAKIDELTSGEKKKLLRTFKYVVQKVAYYRGRRRIWITKENESVELYKELRKEWEDAHFVVIVREPSEFISSYVSLSLTSTEAKHGIDPRVVAGWHKANMKFRIDECNKLIAYSSELGNEGRVTFVTFSELTAGMEKTMERIYRDLQLTVGHDVSRRLSEMQSEQDRRDAGYRNAPQSIEGLETFGQFVKRLAVEAAEARP